jgi:hypothetical protein
MHLHAVKLGVSPYLKIDCKFWRENDVWIGTADQLAITVRASAFEQAKTDMELELGKYVESLLQKEHRAKVQVA